MRVSLSLEMQVNWLLGQRRGELLTQHLGRWAALASERGLWQRVVESQLRSGHFATRETAFNRWIEFRVASHLRRKRIQRALTFSRGGQLTASFDLWRSEKQQHGRD